jgi:hypothetical protein
MNPKSLKQAANEINVFFDLDPAIDLNQKPESLERMLILECAPLLNPKKDKVVPFDQITPEDDFLISEETIAVLTELGAKYREEISTSLKPTEIGVLSFFKIIDGEEPVAEEPVEGEEAEEGTITEEEAIAAKETVLEVDDQDLAEEIKSATKLKELKDIANTNDQFKSIRGKLSSYKTVDDLSADMLELYYASEKPTDTPETEVVDEAQATANKLHEKLAKKEVSVNVVPENEKEVSGNSIPPEIKPKKEKVARVHNEDHKTRAQIFAEIFNEGKQLTMNEWTKEMDSRSDSNSIATARTFTSIYMQILLELKVVTKTKDGKLVKA